MTIIGFLIFLLIAAICGAIGQAIAGYSLGGCLVSIVVGLIGAMLGSWLARQLGFTTIFPVTIEGHTIPIIWAVIGSTIFTAIVGLITRGRSRR
ncbi:MAG TPA: GlsB/YeaQ/YmgE family stress response membrane protein [Balneolaceae bacterium]|nr:GlsB/YeaQ/YmgE family stress response membrane protein [Balneolaceae bacterium]